MRKCTRWWGLLPLLFLSLLARAQSADQAQAVIDRKALDYRMANLITDPRLSTGFLLDYGLALTDLTRYDYPASVPDSAIGSIETFRRAYASLATASVNTAAGWLPPLRTLNQRLTRRQQPGANEKMKKIFA